MLSEEQIDLLAIKHAPPVHPDYVDCDDWHEFARAIEREAYKQGQERMRERAAVASWMHYAEICKKLNINPHDTHYGKFIAADAIRNLEIEEPK